MLPRRYQALEDTIDRSRPLNRDSGEYSMLGEQVGSVAQREFGERPGALQTDHARAHTAQGEGNMIQILAAIGSIKAARRGRRAGTPELRSRFRALSGRG